MKKIKLGDIGSVRMCKRILKEETNSEGGIPFYKISTFGNVADVFIDKDKYENYKTRFSYPKKGEVLISAAGTIGRTVIYNGEDAYFQDSNIVWIENEEKEVLNSFLYYAYQNVRWKTSNGSTILRLYNDDLRNTEILIPEDISEQKRIAKVLSKIDRKISINREINRNLEELAKQIYDYWFVQFDFPNKEGKPYKSSGGKMVWNETLKREIPAGWKNGVLSNIAYITMGQSPEGSSYNEDGIGTIFYQGSTDFGIRFPNVRMYTTKPTRFAKIGDILMSVRAPVGAMNIANSDCCIGRGLSAMNSKIGSITHLYYTMDYFRHTFENKNAVGTTFGSITKDELYNLPVVIPSKEVISAFNVKTIYIFNQQLSTSKEIQELTALRDSLLPFLMSGQVTLNSCLSAHGILFFVKFTIWEVKEYVTWMLKCRYYKVFNHNFVNLWTMNR